MEEWRKIKANPLFEVSNYGRVRRKLVSREPYMYYKMDCSGGYHRVSIFYNESNSECFKNQGTKTKRFLVHRLVAEAFIPNHENKPQVNHIDCNPSNNHVSNLEWCTAGENLKHAYNSGNQSKKGEKNSVSKLTDDQVREIRRLHSTGDYLHREIGDIFNVSQPLITMVVNRKIWTHI